MGDNGERPIHTNEHVEWEIPFVISGLYMSQWRFSRTGVLQRSSLMHGYALLEWCNLQGWVNPRMSQSFLNVFGAEFFLMISLSHQPCWLNEGVTSSLQMTGPSLWRKPATSGIALTAASPPLPQLQGYCVEKTCGLSKHFGGPAKNSGRPKNSNHFHPVLSQSNLGILAWKIRQSLLIIRI